MSEETAADKAVFLVCEWTAGALIFGFIEGISTNKSSVALAVYAILALVFAVVGVAWPSLKVHLVPRFSAFTSWVERLASDYRYKTLIAFLLLGYLTTSVFYNIRATRRDLDAHIRPRRITADQSDKLREYLSKREPSAVNITVVGMIKTRWSLLHKCLALCDKRPGMLIPQTTTDRPI
jgi:hypothetical protein